VFRTTTYTLPRVYLQTLHFLQEFMHSVLRLYYKNRMRYNQRNLTYYKAILNSMDTTVHLDFELDKYIYFSIINNDN